MQLQLVAIPTTPVYRRLPVSVKARSGSRSLRSAGSPGSRRTPRRGRSRSRPPCSRRRAQLTSGRSGSSSRAGRPDEGGERGVGGRLVTLGPGRSTRHALLALGLGADHQGVDRRLVGLDERVHAHLHQVARLVAPLLAEGGLGDLLLEPAAARCRPGRPRASSPRPSRRSRRRSPRPGSSIRSVSASTKYEPPSGSIDVGHAGLVRDHLLRAQRDLRGLLGRAAPAPRRGRSCAATACPPSTAASASMAVRTMLFIGCCAVLEHPGGLRVEPQPHRGGIAWRRIDRAATAPRCAAPHGTSRSPRRSRCGC